MRPISCERLCAGGDGSMVAPLTIEGLPMELSAFGHEWRRKAEFHLTAVSRNAVDRAAGDGAEVWERVMAVAAGRSVDPVVPTPEVRIAHHAGRPELETVVVMVECPAVHELYDDLAQVGIRLPTPPTHVTLYSTDSAAGIGLADATELAERAPPLDQSAQRLLREAMWFDDVFGR